ncbi:MAG: hypothetical protein LBV36_03165 [Chromatiales bacterium]|jgi:HemY protein|nr:hypothetical protein [Chromatiales bacterium]
MRRLFLFLFILLAGVGIAFYAQRDPGYVLVQFNGWTLEFSVTFALLALISGFTLCYVLIRIIGAGMGLPEQWRGWRKRRAEQRALGGLDRGYADLLEGRWERAEKRLVGAARGRENLLLAWLGAARAAQEQGAERRRDDYLRRAASGAPDAEVGLALAQAEMQLGREQFAQAAANLDRLHGMAPRNTQVAVLRLQLALRLGDWRGVLEQLPDLRRRHLIPANRAEEIEQRAAAGMLDDPQLQSESDLAVTWSQLPKPIRRNSELLRRYLSRLAENGAGVRAERLTRETIQNHWDPALVELYGLIDSNDTRRQISEAEGWLRRHSDDAVLLLTLGRLCRRQGLWGKAKDYLQSCVQNGGSRVACDELAVVLETMGERDAALHYYRRGIEVAGSKEQRFSWRETYVRRLPAPDEILSR